MGPSNRPSHGCNKTVEDFSIDPTHKLVLDAALEVQLRRWRRMCIPLGSVMDLFRLYSRELSRESAFCIWWNMWSLFGGDDRVDFLQQISLADPTFPSHMLEAWYRYVAGSGDSLDSLD